ncbi:MAG: gliding motility-associated C-terminal domain-containing protein, partial [Flavobacteriales bacterium]
GDGIPNHLDIDSDNDGVYDIWESGQNSGVDANADGRLDGDVGANGIPEVVDPEDDGTVNYDTQDSDDDGAPDFLDVDDDGDGVNTEHEAPNEDGDGNPNTGNTQDSDSDSTFDYLDMDDDGDGVATIYELPNNDGDGNPNTGDTQDTDGNGTPDYLDTDDDGDGMLTIDEGSNPDDNMEPGDAFDANGNGIPDYLEKNGHDQSETTDEIEVYNAVTPNGDGDNDVFIIRNIEKYPENTVQIFNRWGVVVFETEGYGVDGVFFEGYSNGRATIDSGTKLPDGTYFYVVEYVNEDGDMKQRSGYLYLNY